MAEAPSRRASTANCHQRTRRQDNECTHHQGSRRFAKLHRPHPGLLANRKPRLRHHQSKSKSAPHSASPPNNQAWRSTSPKPSPPTSPPTSEPTASSSPSTPLTLRNQEKPDRTVPPSQPSPESSRGKASSSETASTSPIPPTPPTTTHPDPTSRFLSTPPNTHGSTPSSSTVGAPSNPPTKSPSPWRPTRLRTRSPSNATWKPSATGRQRQRYTMRTSFGTACSPPRTTPPTRTPETHRLLPVPAHPRPAHGPHPRHRRTIGSHPLRPNNSSPTPTPRAASEHAAPILTTIGYINWWEGRGSKAHQYLQFALDTEPGYRFARLTDHMLGAGIIAGWNTNKNTAYRNNLEMP
ncbi:DUF4192 family protein [Paenarthrobacter ureafaciens]|nr:DUF4192 family protein [Paenarthrobacter ureafaciens]